MKCNVVILIIIMTTLTACSKKEPLDVQDQRNAYRQAKYSLGVAQENARYSRINVVNPALAETAKVDIQKAKDTGVITSNLETQLANLKAQAEQ